MEANNTSNNTKNNDSMKNPKLSWWISWPTVVIATIIFWPVGIFLIWKRIGVDKKTAMISGKIITIIGWLSVTFAGLGLLVSLSEGFGSDDAFVIIFFIIAGCALIFLGRKTRKNAERFKKYISIIVNHEVTYIDNIASAIPISYDVAKKELQKMIDRGYFPNAYINDTSREIILPKKQESYSVDTGGNVKSNSNVEMIVVSCNGCGANNKIAKGTVDECQFCGSPING